MVSFHWKWGRFPQESQVNTLGESTGPELFQYKKNMGPFAVFHRPDLPKNPDLVQ
jgi:hypothetical protein